MQGHIFKFAGGAQKARYPLLLMSAVITAMICFVQVGAAFKTKFESITSPDGRLVIDFYLDSGGEPRYMIRLDGKTVLTQSKLGLIRDDADFSKDLRLLSASKSETVRDRYEILTAKRRINAYLANRRVFNLQTDAGKKMDIIFQVFDEGVAFRYHFPETDAKMHRITEEKSSFHFLPETRAWLQPIAEAKSGWEKTNPSYEEYYEKEIEVGTISPTGAGWVYPALFHSGDVWLLISETGLTRGYCGTRLSSESPNGEYRVAFPDPRENFPGGAVNPESKLPWLTPWRIIAVGSLGTIAESMLGVDLAEKPAVSVPKSSIKPGKASWSWVLLGDGQTNFATQKRFIDYAASMGWRYCLVDALWDKQIGYEKIKELVDYARTKKVGILLWYNSAGDWNSSPQTPRDLMLTRESRIREFELLKKMGVAGLKIDFFGGDGQSMIGYYLDILEDAAPFGFMINFHGATLPRGWQRTFPHLMTMEAIRGFEFVTFEQSNADAEPSHAAMLPFTRNIFDPMDFTPTALDRVNDRITRRTTSGFELALSVLFTSGIQHYAETPEGMAKAPKFIQEFLKNVPEIWDDVKFIDGFPGKYAVLARRGNGRWYIAGINGEATERKLTLDPRRLPALGNGELMIDGDRGNLSFRREKLDFKAGKKLEIILKPYGGFVIVGQ
ncbi:MAG: glycoside hydrolase family 97 catalytic domain-containing protein [Pyrinomonadaceae bacterium]